MKQEILIPTKTLCYRVTRRCNLACPFCQAPYNSKELSIEKHKKFLEKLKQSGIESVKFTGGEPYIYKNFNKLIKYAVKLGLDITVCSNSILMKPKDFKILKRYNCKLKISLHGLGGLHNEITNSDTEKEVIKNILYATRLGIYTSIHVLLTEKTTKELDKLFKFAVENNIKKVSLIPLVKRGKAKEIELKLSSQKMKNIFNKYKKLYGKKMKVRFLDLHNKAYYVLETDGNLYVELDSESKDKKLYDL